MNEKEKKKEQQEQSRTVLLTFFATLATTAIAFTALTTAVHSRGSRRTGIFFLLGSGEEAAAAETE